jgi:hypothetical protein
MMSEKEKQLDEGQNETLLRETGLFKLEKYENIKEKK